MKLSLIVPCYNEAENVAPFQEAVISAFSGCGYDYEIVFVNDGSRDATLHNLKKLHARQECPVKVISFSRNFGKEAGLYAGLEHATGEYIALIDADLQQRPEIVRDMVTILDEKPQIDVVAAYQDRRGEGKILSFFKKAFYGIINRLSTVKLKSDASDFRTFRRSVADSILELKEYHRFSKGIFAWVGFDTEFIPYTACERHAGTTKWSFMKLELMYKVGFRITSLGWNEQNVLCGSNKTGGGLTDLGREYIKEAQRLGMIIDVSHCSDEAFWDMIDCT